MPVSFNPLMIRSADTQPPVRPPSGIPPLYADEAYFFSPACMALVAFVLSSKGTVWAANQPSCPAWFACASSIVFCA